VSRWRVASLRVALVRRRVVSRRGRAKGTTPANLAIKSVAVWARAATSASRLKLPAVHCGSHMLGHTCPRKNSEGHIDASHARQPLVKGGRLVRYEVNAVMGVSQAAGSPALLRLSLWWLLRVAATSSTRHPSTEL